MSYTQPLLLLFSAVALLGLAFYRHGPAIWMARFGVFALFLVAWPPAAWLLSRPLEGQYSIRPFEAQQHQYDAIVIPASSVSPPQFERPYELPDDDTYHRCRFGAWLYAQRPVPVLLSGGREKQSYTHSYAEDMRTLLITQGVPAASIWTEEQSRSTHENAAYSAAILKQHHIRVIALVVDATSMPRAQLSFQKQGLFAVPAVCDFYELSNWHSALPNWKAVRQNELTLHEGLGLLWYRLRGWA